MLVEELSTLSEYGRISADRFALHVGVVVLAAFGAAWAMRRVRPWVADPFPQRDLRLVSVSSVANGPSSIAEDSPEECHLSKGTE